MRILFIGLGSIGKRHLRLLNEIIPDSEFIAYRSSRKEKDHPAEVEEYFDIQTALDQEPDIAFITNPTSEHIDYSIKCARNDCHLFIEKPISHNLKQTDTLQKIVEERNLVTMAGYNFRFHPVINTVKDKIGELGEVYYARAVSSSYLPEWRPEQDYRESYSAKKELGGGAVLDLSHEIDYLRWIFGDAESIKSVTGQFSHLEIETEDLCEAIIDFEKGTCSLHLDYFRKDPERKIEVIGKNGSIIGDLIENEVQVNIQGKEDKTEKFDIERDYTYKKELQHFLKKVRQDKDTDIDVLEGIKTLELVNKIKEDSKWKS